MPLSRELGSSRHGRAPMHHPAPVRTHTVHANCARILLYLGETHAERFLRVKDDERIVRAARYTQVCKRTIRAPTDATQPHDVQCQQFLDELKKGLHVMVVPKSLCLVVNNTEIGARVAVARYLCMLLRVHLSPPEEHCKDPGVYQYGKCVHLSSTAVRRLLGRAGGASDQSIMVWLRVEWDGFCLL